MDCTEISLIFSLQAHNTYAFLTIIYISIVYDVWKDSDEQVDIWLRLLLADRHGSH